MDSFLCVILFCLLITLSLEGKVQISGLLLLKVTVDPSLGLFLLKSYSFCWLRGSLEPQDDPECFSKNSS